MKHCGTYQPASGPVPIPFRADDRAARQGVTSPFGSVSLVISSGGGMNGVGVGVAATEAKPITQEISNGSSLRRWAGIKEQTSASTALGAGLSGTLAKHAIPITGAVSVVGVLRSAVISQT